MKNTLKAKPAPSHSVATLTIRGASEQTANHIRSIADWLEEQARNLRKDSKNYSKRFTARYILGADRKRK